jgi:hypothetical protein
MMRIVVLAVLALVMVTAMGCSSAGPFVTDVGYDGQGNLVVTKNTIVLDAFFGVVKNGDNPQTYVLAAPPEKKTTGQ